MQERKPILFPVFFLLVLALALALFIVLPRQAYSPLEKRFLAQPPRFTMEGGQFSQDFEAYAGDVFPLREQWVGLNAAARQLFGLNITGEVWRMQDGSLAEAPLGAQPRLARNLGILEDFAGMAGIDTRVMVVPHGGAVNTAGGPYAYPDRAIIQGAEEMAPGLVFIDVVTPFVSAGRPLYYRTDPHWNVDGAHLAYTEAAKALGFEPKPLEWFAVEHSEGFYGSAYARSGLWRTKPDTLGLIDPGVPVKLTFDGREEAFDSLYFKEHLSQPDQYPVFLDGNHGLTVIENLERAEGSHLVVLKDSFGNSLVPFLVNHYRTISVVDPRAYRGSLQTYIRDQGVDQALVVYSLRNLGTDTNLGFLTSR